MDATESLYWHEAIALGVGFVLGLIVMMFLAYKHFKRADQEGVSEEQVSWVGVWDRGKD
jgi:hypothetical protein